MNWSHFNWIDYTILAVILLSTIISYARGFVREAISLVVWIVAIWVAYNYCRPFAQTVLTMMDIGTPRIVAAFMILLISVLLFGAFINVTLSHFINKTGLSGVDRVLGMAFGFARGVLLVAVAILAMQMTEIPKQVVWQKAQLIPQFSGITVWLGSFVPDEFDKVKDQIGHSNGSQISAETTPQATSPSSPKSLTPTVSIKLRPEVTVTPPGASSSPASPNEQTAQPMSPATTVAPSPGSTTTTYY
jgi:membrane protein required for colicin V production